MDRNPSAARVWRACWNCRRPAEPLFPDTPPSGWEDNADLLVPDFFDPDTNAWHIAVQTWVIEVDGLTIVVDTGVGNDRQRPHMPPLDHLNTGFLAALKSAGSTATASTSWSTRTSTPTTSGGTPCWSTTVGADVSDAEYGARRTTATSNPRARGATTTAHRGGSGCADTAIS